MSTGLAPRSERFPLVVPARSDLAGPVWTENISLGGVGLVVGREAAGQQLGEVHALSIWVSDEERLSATAEVCRRHLRPDGTVLLGLAWQRPGAGLVEKLRAITVAPGGAVVVVGGDDDLFQALSDAAPRWPLRALPGVQALPEVDVPLLALLRADHSVALPALGRRQPAQILIGVSSPETTRALRAGQALGAWAVGEPPAQLVHLLVTASRLAHLDHPGRFPGADPPATAAQPTTTTTEAPVDGPARARARSGRPPQADDDLVAGCAPMRAALEAVDVVAPRKVVVLLQGETGSGKEVMAKAVHRRSARADRPYVVQDCGALTETLLDSELFGHVRGAFTGANADHPGLFVLADGGTIFLDEIQNTSAALQAKLLRVIETGEVRPVGGTRTRTTDVRVIAACNTDLEAAVAAGSFRSDLYYRLTVFPIQLPPLRTRGEDVIVLATRLGALAANTHGLDPPTFDDVVADALRAYTWPGNVRQLKNVMERAVLLANGGPLQLRHFPDAIVAAGQSAPPRTLDGLVRAYERDLIARALDDADGVLLHAAAALRTNRVTLARKARAHGLVDAS